MDELEADFNNTGTATPPAPESATATNGNGATETVAANNTNGNGAAAVEDDGFTQARGGRSRGSRAMRGGFRGNFRGGERGGFRGGFRGGERGDFRGGRGMFFSCLSWFFSFFFSLHAFSAFFLCDVTFSDLEILFDVGFRGRGSFQNGDGGNWRGNPGQDGEYRGRGRGRGRGEGKT